MENAPLPNNWMQLVYLVLASLIGAGVLPLIRQIILLRDRREQKLITASGEVSKYLVHRVEELRVSVEKLQLANEKLENELDRLRKEHAQCRRDLSRLEKELNALRSRMDKEKSDA